MLLLGRKTVIGVKILNIPLGHTIIGDFSEEKKTGPKLFFSR